MACLSPKLEAAQSPEFQKLKEWYPERSDAFLVRNLAAYRKHMNKSEGWYPSDNEKGAFTRFMRYGLHKAEGKQTESTIGNDDVLRVYNDLQSAYTREQLDDRLNYVTRLFGSAVSNYIKRHPGKDGEISMDAAIKRMGGYKKIMKGIFSKLEGASYESELAALKEKYGEPKNDKAKAGIENLAARRAVEKKKLVQNQNRLSAMVAKRISERYGLVISNTGLEIDLVNYRANEEDAQDAENEDKGTQGERFIDSRTKMIFATLSMRVKDLLASVPMTDNAGKVLRDDMGEVRYVDSRQVMNTLLSALQNTTSESFLDDLNDAADRFPFLKGLVKKVDGSKRKSDIDLLAPLYVDFKRVTSRYGYINIKDGSYNSDIANIRSHGNSLMRQAGTNMTSGFTLDDDYSFYSGKQETRGLVRDDVESVRDMVAGKLSVFDDLGYIFTNVGGSDSRKADKKNKYEAIGGIDGIKSFLDDHPDAIDNIYHALRGIGISVTKEQIRNAALQPISKKTAKVIGVTKQGGFTGTNRLMAIEDAILSIYNSAVKVKKTGDGRSESVYYNSSKAFFSLNAALGVSLNDEVESRVLVNGKTMQTHTTPNLLHELVGELNNDDALSDEEYDKVLNDNYLRYQGFTHNGEPVGLLKRLKDRVGFGSDTQGNTTSGPLRLIDQAEFNGVEYESLSASQKAAAQIINFIGQDRAVEMLIQSDYTSAWDFISNIGVGLGVTSEDLHKAVKERLETKKKAYETETGESIDADAFREMSRETKEEEYDRLASLLDENGKYKGGVPAVEEIADEVLVEIDRIDRISRELEDDPLGLKSPRLRNRDKYGLKFQIFPEFNTNGFMDAYRGASDADAALEFVKQQVAEQLEKVIEKDFQKFEQSGVFKNPMMKTVKNRATGWEEHFYSKSGKITDIDPKTGVNHGLDVYAKLALRDMSLNYFSGRLQMAKVFAGGLENFDGLLDFEKRSMMFHATRKGIYTEATINGEKVGRKNQRVVYLKDEETKSAVMDDIGKLLDRLYEQKLITGDMLKKMKSAYGKITSTDGQGFRTFESYRSLMAMQGKWTDEQEKAYQHLMNDDIADDEVRTLVNSVYFAINKPVYTGYEYVGDMRIPVLHKYSEIVLFPPKLINRIFTQNNAQLRGLSLAAEALSKGADGPVDMFLFLSNVKVGAHTVLDPFGFQTEEYIDENGNKKQRQILGPDGNPVRKATTAEQIRDYIVSKTKEQPFAIHTLSYKYYGEAASTPTHVENERIAWSSQAIKHAKGDVRPGDKLTVNGQEMETSRAMDILDEVEAASIATEAEKLDNLFADQDALSDLLQEELAGKSYSSPELEFALTRLKDGSMAVPLFSPGTDRGSQQLFHSIIKKRLTRRKVKGANIYQATSFGNDVDPFGVGFELAEEDKPKVRISKDGKRIECIECILPIHDSRLEVFADKNGNITPARLRELVEKGIIPEDALRFVAYRTPSDDLHSLLPLRVIGFTSKTSGANIIIPKEAMVMTGHDYDGDKLRCYFQDFKVVWDEDALKVEYDRAISDRNNIMRAIMDQDDTATMTFEQFKRAWARDPRHYSAGNIQMYQYDYSKSALENGQIERDNAMVQIIFANLTSEAGVRMLIPGGFDQTKVYAYSLFLTRAIRQNPELRNNDEFKKAGVKFGSVSSVYDSLVKMDLGTLQDLMKVASGNTTPYSFEHSMDSYDYIMGGARMIDVYALYGSAAKLMQTLDLHYVPIVKKGEAQSISLFGKQFDKLFNVTDKDGHLTSLVYARLLNAAVDNGKSPILGYLNQSPEMGELTFFLYAVGLSEEEIHLFMNQPALIELAKRRKERDAGKFVKTVNEMITELLGDDIKVFGKYSNTFKGADYVSAMTRDAYVQNLDTGYDELFNTDDEDLRGSQIALLRVIASIYESAEDLADFVKNTRPEASTAGIGTTISGDIVKLGELNKLRRKVSRGKARISGMGRVLQPGGINEGDSAETIMEKAGKDELPQVKVLQSAMQDRILPILSRFYPQAKDDWSGFIAELAGEYDYKKLNENVIRGIINEMITWKLEQSARLVGDDIEEKRRDLVVEMPNRLWRLKYQIGKAREQRDLGKKVERPDLLSLADNIFLNKLRIDAPDSPQGTPRIAFEPGGPVVEGLSDSVRRDWAALIAHPDERIRKFGTDLFLYNMFTNGFGFGMYEFSHFAPYSVLSAVDGYLDSLKAVGQRDFAKDDLDLNNFREQYYMNHWGDSHLVPYVKKEKISEALFSAGLSETDMEKELDKWGIDHFPHMITTKEDEGVIPYRLDEENGRYVLQRAAKLGARTKRQQVSIQYNPNLNYWEDLKPLQTGFDSSWGNFGMEMVENSNPANLSAEGMATEREELDRTASLGEGDFLSRTRALFGPRPQIAKTEEKAIPVVEENRAKLENAPATEDNPLMAAPVQEGETVEDSNPDMNAAFMNAARNLFGKIVRRTVDEKGNRVINVEEVPMTPRNVREMRRQQAFVDLNAKLREILRSKGIGIGVITSTEERIGLAGITDFETANVTAEGLVEMIRLAHGYEGEEALPEEFAHMALEMLGYDNPLVLRLMNQLAENRNAMEEAYDGMYDEYESRYGANNEKLIKEAAGKLVAKALLRQQQIESSPVRRLIQRIVDAIKNLLRKISIREVQNAILDANQIASKLARDLLSGKLADEMSRERIGATDYFYRAQKVLTNRTTILDKMIKNATKRLSLLQRRAGLAGAQQKSASILQTEKQIDRLNAALKGQKTESAIIDYLKNSLDFLASTEKSLDDAIDSGRPVNSVCKKLNAVRDTLYGYSEIIDDIRNAIREKEVEDSPELREAIKETSYCLEQFYDKYNSIAMDYFERTLMNVYGEHGVTKTVGKDKGKSISIHDMARRAESDIKLSTRWLSSLGDTGDYVLIAIDSLTRDAKVSARQKTEAVERRVNVAFDKLLKATGSRDQSFMFEKKLGEDGKMHKTGFYISEAEAKKLSPAQKAFYDEMMSIKKEIDKTVPDVLVKPGRIVALRKYTMERMRSTEGLRGKGVAVWESIKNTIMDTSDDIEFEKDPVIEDFQGNKIDMLPVKYLNKGKNESWDDMVDDVATSILAYAGMGNEYNELNAVLATLENARYMSMNRDIVQHTGWRKKVETVLAHGRDADYYYEQDFTKKQSDRSNIQQILDDFFQMQIYGHTEKAEGTFGKTRISKRKTVNFLNRLASYQQMAFNLQQRIANVGTGAVNIAIESAGKGVFNAKDVAWATAQYMRHGINRLADTGKIESDNKLSLFAEKFDLHQNNGRNKVKYGKGRMSRIFNTGLLFAGLNMGEDYLALTTALAAARNYKVKDASGKTKNLWDAYEVKYTDPVNKTGAHLEIIPGFTNMDGSAIAAEDEKRFANMVIGTNFRLQGIYNYDDRSAVQQYAFGSLVMMYRKWIYPALQRRYGPAGYNLLLNQDVEGYYRTAFRLIGDSLDEVRGDQSYAVLLNIFKYGEDLLKSFKMNYSKLTDYEKTNIARAGTEFSILMAVVLGAFLMGKLPPDKKEKEEARMASWLDNMAIYHLYRIRNEVGSVTPSPMIVKEGLNILSNPFAAIKPLQSMIQGLGLLWIPNYTTEIKSGMYKGHSKAYKYFWNLPVLSMYKQVQHFKDPSSLINYFKNDHI